VAAVNYRLVRALDDGADARSASQGPRIDVGARMRGMWR